MPTEHRANRIPNSKNEIPSNIFCMGGHLPFILYTDGQAIGLHMRKNWGQSRARSCQKATALAAATFRLSTPWDMGILAV